MVIAICRPDCQVTLIDSMERRCEWLLDAIAELELTNVSVKLGRAEEFVGNYSADVVTSRAVAALKKLLPWTMPLLRKGRWVAPRIRRNACDAGRPGSTARHCPR